MSEHNATSRRKRNAVLRGKMDRILRSLQGLSARSRLANFLAERSPHEVAIWRHFGGDVAFTDSSPRFEGPLVILGFTNRSGSNLLAEHLIASGACVGLGEALNHLSVVEKSQNLGCKSFPNYVEAIFKRHKSRAPAQALFGMKANAYQLNMLLKWNIHAMFTGGMKVISNQRVDRIAQGVSYSIASQTKQWTSDQEVQADREPEFRAEDIARFIRSVGRQNDLMSLICSTYRIEVHPVFYEDLLRDPELVVRSAASFLGHPVPNWSVPKETRLKRQGAALNRSFAERFRAELLAHTGHDRHQ